MPTPDCTDYDKLRQALMLRFRMTGEGFREKFRSAVPMNGETCSQYCTRLRNFLDRWVELSQTTKDYEALFDLFLKERFLANCATPLELFLREKEDARLADMVARAEQYVEAHGWANFAKRAASKEKTEAASPRANEKPGTPNQMSAARGLEAKRCFLCSRPGHVAQNCRAAASIQSPQQRRCFKCGKTGHPSWKCWQGDSTKPKETNRGSASACIEEGYVELRNGEKVPVVNTGLARKDLHMSEGLPVVTGLVEGERARVLRDTGCNTVIVRRGLVHDKSLTGTKSLVYLLDRSVLMLPEAWVVVDTPYFKGRLRAKCMDDPIYDLILGNVDGVRRADDPDPNWSAEAAPAAPPLIRDRETPERKDGCERETAVLEEQGGCGAPDSSSSQASPVVTRAQSRDKAPFRGLKVNRELPGISREELIEEQGKDPTLKVCFGKLDQACGGRKGDSHTFFMHGGVLTRKYTSKFGGEFVQVVVPKRYRNAVLELAHDGVMGGHQGTRRTLLKMRAEFFWPAMQANAKRYVASCDTCQRTTPKGHTRKAPLVKVPIIDTPFQKVAIDIVGPLNPRSAQGNRYILTMIDYATRYPDAVALPSIETERVAEALVQMFSRVGVPREVLSDRATNFTSEVMKEVSRLLSVKQLHTAPYHPMANGLVERFNGTLKQMLKRMCREKPNDWDRYLAPLLFAYREVPQESLGFAPFELLYGRSVRGPLSVLRELWTNSEIPSETRTTYEYVLALRERLEHTCRLAHEELEKAGERYGRYYNLKSRKRSLKPGDQVLILLPTDHNKLLMQWRGPFPVVDRRGDVDYAVDLGHSTKTFHINMLKKYQERATSASVAGASAVLPSEEGDSSDITLPPPYLTQFSRDVRIGSNLTEEQLAEARELLREFEVIFSDLPGTTGSAECKLDMRTELPVHVKQYPLPFAVKEVVDQEVSDMLRLGIAERSVSAHNSPLLAVQKSDGTHRVYDFHVEYIKGSENVGADYMSRID
ncbi:uncharacterized protein LOC121837179 [Ixodes scapularis]|uniref:uncharacterized protein LOC121837179 n=1 Tax=Ixodes scapularis TaxID=6945 RepID=UPI001C37FBE0|nr:uncharacterized protein LOC121837179 [Ixodes scapularis]